MSEPGRTVGDMDEPEFTERDLDYVRREYVDLDRLCAERAETPQQVRELIADSKLPRATYVLPDGTELFPPDYFELLDEAGSVEAMREVFDRRYLTATSALGLLGKEPEENWHGYLSGEFGVCLWEVSPESIVEKSALIAEIDGLTGSPAPADGDWRARLTDAVDRLDEIERPFTDYDRQRWGTTSRDRYITAVRARHLDTDQANAQ
jgi:hypothetical protein